MKNVIAMILAGGKGERLYPLTERRPKPCVPFGGSYKIIDFGLSNLFNSEIRRIYVLSQYCGYSMTKHIRDSWSHWTGRGEFVAAVSPETMSGREEWFRGTADAIHQYLRFFEFSDATEIAILGGDHIYKMDFRKMIEYHREQQADITIAALEVTPAEASRFGIMAADEAGRVTAFKEKPQDPERIPGKESCYASMGIYIFNKDKLVKYLKEGRSLIEDLDFGQHVIPLMLETNARVCAYNFSAASTPGMQSGELGYWRDVGTVDSYYEANMDLISISPRLNLYNYQWPILTNMPNLPPAKTVFDGDDRRGQCLDSYVGNGSIISGGTVRRSIVSPDVKVHSFALVEDCILFNRADIGRGARLKGVIVDKRIRIPAGDCIGYDHEADRARGFTVTPAGIVVVPSLPNTEDPH